MKIVILMEDTQGNKAVQVEHGLSIYVETKEHILLMDTGASSKTWENGNELGIDLKKIDTVVISHGHYDHAGGLISFSEKNSNAKIYIHENAFNEYYHGERYIGMDKDIRNLPNIIKINENEEIDNELSLITGIKGRRLWPKGNLLLSERINGKNVQDEFSHEQCLLIKSEGKEILISGCAHNGILNILDRYNDIYSKYPDYVISGFHMMKKKNYTSDEVEDIKKTAEELKKMQTVFLTGHCTGQPALDIMKDIMGDQLIQIHSGDEFIL